MGFLLFNNSLVDDGSDMRAASVEFNPDLTVRSDSNNATGPIMSAGLLERKLNDDLHVLLATTGQLPSTARLAIELHDVGAEVSLIAPSNHPGKTLNFLWHRMTYRAPAPRTCLEAAMIRVAPDLVIPCDERTVRDLHAIWRNTQNPAVKLLIERSTAPAEHFPTITSRAKLLALARQHGVRVPNFMEVPSLGELRRWTAEHAAPFVLKADGSWAGFGVRIISDKAMAEDAYVQMTRPVSGRLAFRESLLEGNHFSIRSWLKRERPVMSVQDYVDGWPANIGVACWQGEVLASICAESVATVSATGPSTVSRIIDNAEMVEAAKRVTRALGLSGMVGFDFMIEAATGAAYLIEMNPRNTPICALPLGTGRDLAEALVARLLSRPMLERPKRTENDIIAFFPDTWQEDPGSHFLHSGFHDVPWHYPALVRMLMQPERRERYGILRLLRKIWLARNAGREAHK
jgi:carbamoylphosphate synthase large subunit